MIQRNKGDRYQIHAEIIKVDGKTINKRQSQAKILEEKIEEITDPEKRAEGKWLLRALQDARKVLIEKSEIKIYLNIQKYGKIDKDWSIVGNEELYYIVKEVFVEETEDALI